MSSSVANPFVVGGAISDPAGKGFFGRDDVFEFVRTSLNSETRPPILLYGQRRMGKSSILKQLFRYLPPDYVCVYYDLQGRAQFSLDEVLYGLGRAIADAVKIPRPEEADATERTFSDLLARAVAALDGRPERLVLLFDEFDVIDQQFTGPQVAARKFIPYLARLVAEQPKIGFILVVGRRTDELSEGFFSALLKDAVQKRIGRLEPKDADRLVSASFVSVAPPAMDAIRSLTAGHPFCLQVLCYSIWNRCCQEHSRPITLLDVEGAFAPAIELGTLGLNWVYDGLDKPAHRLFLSALAGLAGENALGEVSTNLIEHALLERRVGVDEQQLRMVPRDLQNWDIVQPGSVGVRFTVPMIGTWIQRNRPLEGLEQETRLINPRAAKLYELAVDYAQRSEWNDAIENYRNALSANPVFVEAQSGLAAALRARKRPGDLNDAIEAYERVLELDPNSSRTGLMDALVESIEASRAYGDRAVARFKRLKELDSQGMFLERGKRLLELMTQVRFGYGTSKYLNEAVQLAKATGNEDLASQAGSRLALVARSDRISGITWAIASGFWLVSAYFADRIPWVSPFLQLGLAALAGIAISVSVVAERDGNLTFRRTALGPVILSLVSLGFGLISWRPPVWAGGVGAFFVAVILNQILNPIPDKPAELSPVEPSSTTSLRDSAASLFERWAKLLKTSGKSGKSVK